MGVTVGGMRAVRREGVPELPARLRDPVPVVIVGSAAWVVASVGLFVAWLVGARPLDTWFWTAVAGSGLGLWGYSVVRWQRAAARRGSRSAQTGLHKG